LRGAARSRSALVGEIKESMAAMIDGEIFAASPAVVVDRRALL
jgi:hypothetical protein